MAANFRQRVVLCLFCVFFISTMPLFSSQSNSAQNIETTYPFSIPTVPSTPNSPNNQSIPPSPSPTKPPPPSPPLPPTQTPSNSSTKKAVAKAVVVTAASTVVISGLFFFLLLRYTRRRRKKDSTSSHGVVEPVVARDEFTRFNGNLKGLIVDEDGLDMLYWRKLEGANNTTNFNKEIFNKDTRNEEKEVKRMISRGNRSKKSEPPIQEIPLLRDRSSTSNNQVWPELEVASNQSTKPPSQPFNGIALKAVEKRNSSTQDTRCSSPPSPPPEPPVPKLVLAIPKKQSPAPPPPPPIPVKKSPAPPPPPPPKAGDDKRDASSSGEGETGNGNGQVKLKPLHWDKVNANVGHSMVWDKIDGGSFR